MSCPGYTLSAKTQLALSPRLQQAVRLLQMSSLDFTQELRQALDSNPFLEEITEADTIEEAALEATDGCEEDVRPADSTIEMDGAVDEHDVGNETFDDDYFRDPADTGSAPSAAGDNRANESDPLGWISAPAGLRDHLRSQVCGRGLPQRLRLAVEIVIETLDDDGYLRHSVEEAAAALDLAQPLTGDELSAAVSEVQRFDPVGVAARDLAECLSLQLRAEREDLPGRTLALQIAERHLQLLADKADTALLKTLGCNAGQLAEAVQLIRGLNPRPAERFSTERVQYVEPEVIVSLQNGRLRTRINPAVLPRARLNSQCVALLRRARDGRYPEMRQQLQEAQWLLKNAEQRHVTIQRVAEVIVARQKAFFAYGDVALKPLALQEVADELGLHESTVSRATSNKYMATPRGTFEFKHFFSRTLATDTGGSCSASAVRALIRELIEAENPEAPLSDVTLTQRLSRQGIRVARRTVTKYRQQMRLPAVELRRRVQAA